MLMKRLSEPLSSQMLARKPGYFESRLLSTSCTVAASTSTDSAPFVNFRSGAGMTTLSDMINTSQCFFECRELGFNGLKSFQRQGIQRFEAVAGDGQYSEVAGFDAALLKEFLCNGDSHPASCLRKYSFCLGEQLDAFDDFRIRGILRPAAAFGNQARRIVTVGRVADGERLRDRIGFHGPNLASSPFHRINDRVAPRSLRAIQP